MLRIALVIASQLLALSPALADGKNSGTPAEESTEDLRTVPSQAFSNAAHNVTTSQQQGAVTANAATQMGVSTLYGAQ